MRKLILICFALSITFVAFSQTPQDFLIAKKTNPPAGLMFVGEQYELWNATRATKTSGSFSVQTGDILVAIGLDEDNTAALSVSSTDGATWTRQQLVQVNQYNALSIWTCSSPGSASITVSATNSYGFTVLQFRGSAGGIGASAKTNTTGAPSLSITTTANNSWLVVANSDWTEQTGARTWRTVNSITPSSGNGLEFLYHDESGGYASYGAYYNDVGTAGSKTVGLSAPGSQKYSIVAVEIKQ